LILFYSRWKYIVLAIFEFVICTRYQLHLLLDDFFVFPLNDAPYFQVGIGTHILCKLINVVFHCPGQDAARFGLKIAGEISIGNVGHTDVSDKDLVVTWGEVLRGKHIEVLSLPKVQTNILIAQVNLIAKGAHD
jgi:hypothetical protein